ncbi:MAG: hypothetical protein IJC43_10330 [Clostridia bacterium]|nr:hypothetical protein [Clostridia bacterium]
MAFFAKQPPKGRKKSPNTAGIMTIFAKCIFIFLNFAKFRQKQIGNCAMISMSMGVENNPRKKWQSFPKISSNLLQSRLHYGKLWMRGEQLQYQ